MPSISIIIPTKDRPDFLRASVASALSALPVDAEILVIDDNGSLPAINTLKDTHHDRLKILVNNGTMGPSGARNFGVSKAKKKVLLFLDDDDLLRPGYAEYVAQLAQSARYGFSAIDRFKESPQKLTKFTKKAAIDVGSLPFRKSLAGLGCGFWINRQDFLALGGLDETLLVNEDTDFSIRAQAAKLVGIYQPEPGVLVRVHHNGNQSKNAGQITKRSNAGERAEYFTRILEKNAEFFARHHVAKRYINKRRAKMLAKAGHFSEGFAASATSLTELAYFLLNFVIYFAKRP